MIARTDRVNDHSRFDAASHRSPERGDELFADPIVIENVAAQRKRFFGVVDRREHRRIGRVAAAQRFHAIAVQ